MTQWVRFTRQYDHRARRGVFVSYAAGSVLPVPRSVERAAVAAGAAVQVEKPEGARTTKAGQVKKP